MASPAYAILFSAQVSASAISGSAGDALIQDASTGLYVLATAAARGSRRATGIALAPYTPNSAVEIQQFGQVDPTTAGLGVGSASWVRVSTTGALERCTPAGSDDVVGWVDTDGTLHLCCGFLTAAMVSGGGGATPTGTGVPHVVGGVQNAAASLIVDADVSGSAAIAGTKVAPNFGAQNVSFGTNPASTGNLQGPNSTSFKARNAANSGDFCIATTSAADEVYVGCNTSFGERAQFVYICPTISGFLYTGVGNAALRWNPTNIQVAVPIVGAGAPYAGMNGLAPVTLTAAQSYDVPSSEYSNSVLTYVSNGANVVRLPPATDAQAFMKFIWNVSGGGTISVRDTNGVSAAATLASGTGAWFLWANAKVKQLTAAFTVA